MKELHLVSNEKKNSEYDFNKIEARFAEGKQKINSLKIKLQKQPPEVFYLKTCLRQLY